MNSFPNVTKMFAGFVRVTNLRNPQQAQDSEAWWKYWVLCMRLYVYKQTIKSHFTTTTTTTTTTTATTTTTTRTRNKNNNSLEQPTPSNCHSFIPGRTELNRKPSEAAANSHRSSTGSKDWLHRCIGHPNWEHISRVGDSPPTTPVAGQWGHVGTRTLQLSWPCQHMMYM